MLYQPIFYKAKRTKTERVERKEENDRESSVSLFVIDLDKIGDTKRIHYIEVCESSPGSK